MRNYPKSVLATTPLHFYPSFHPSVCPPTTTDTPTTNTPAVSPYPSSTAQSLDFWGDYVCLSASLLRQVKAQLLLLLLLLGLTPPSPVHVKDDMIDTQVVIVAPHADSVGESLLTFSYSRGEAQLTARMMKAQEAVSGSLS